MENKKKTIVLGASTKPQRYSYRAINMLREYGHPVVAVGLRKGRVADVDIQTGQPTIDNVDTVTLYLNPKNQEPHYQYILDLKPRRVIFNPGTENPDFINRLKENGIQTIENCTLVMLGSGLF